MKITVCIGSSCHIKGSRAVEERGLEDRVELSGTFCMGNCKNGVCIKLDEEQFSVSPEEAAVFFENEVMTRL